MTKPKKEINQKKQTSAALPASEVADGIKRVRYEDLTLEDAVRMSDAEFAKIPYNVRKRLMSQA